MQLAKIKKYLLQPKTTIKMINNRYKSNLFDLHWKKNAKNKIAQHTWQQICQKHSIPSSFETFLNQVSKQNFILQKLYVPDNQQLIKQADAFCNQIFTILGSKPKQFQKIDWHCDFRLQQQNPKADCYFDTNSYYKDISIITSTSNQIEKDIKVPWELSRLYYFFILGHAWKITKNKKYLNTFCSHFDNWYKQNPFLLGVNWKSPMEVAIRAINLTWALYLFGDAQSITSSYWQTYICSLYDHFFYLENNWELYDYRTNNHYLSNLLGYLYCCLVFQPLGISKKISWCFNEILDEMDKQIFDDGTSYEGSTRYHQLVTEIFYHVKLLSEAFKHELPASFTDKLNKMFTFITWCTPANGKLISIGDNDSGRITYYGLSRKIIKKYTGHVATSSRSFTNFGLTIIKTKEWHVSLRRTRFNKNQPSGHFHNDNNGITVAYKNVPIIIDPGTFVYTPSAAWRNKFRSASSHSTIFTKYEPIPLTNDIFYLELKPSKTCYKNISIERSINVKQNTIEIIDRWHAFNPQPRKLHWQFVLHPAITVKQTKNELLLMHNKKTFSLKSDLVFESKECFVSFDYGTKIKSSSLLATLDLNNESKKGKTIIHISF